ncbi:hypothetical protein IPH19_02215 [Candidatus Uhrbacteria bacterium]|nr:MAG: hypothetical protein IPH19_02215 [Candidatus Uhrbacteria bacterium]
MAVTTKRKVTAKKETTTVRRERLRLRDWMLFWILVLANVALVCAIFGNIDVNTLKPAGMGNEDGQSNQTMRESELEAQVAVLEGDLSRLQKDLETRPISSTGYTQSGNYDFDQECYAPDSEAAPGAAETYIPYRDPKTSVLFNVPYNFSWGTTNCPPVQIQFDGEQDVISFGPSVGGEGGEARDSGLRISAATTTAAALAGARIELTGSETSDSSIRQRTINGLAVYSYRIEYGLGGGLNIWLAVGRNYTYRLSSNSWLTDAEAIKIIQSLRVTK